MRMTQEEIESLINEKPEPNKSKDIDELINLDELVPVEENITNEKSNTIEDLPKKEIVDDENINSINDIPKLEEDKSENNSSIEDDICAVPATNEHKIVNQLNEVTEDTEKKATKIFDTLNFVLDNNNIIEKNANNSLEFIEAQIELLKQLSGKFPNIDILKDNLQMALKSKKDNEKTISMIEDINNDIFESMELIQYHDIISQKIERGMYVIKKITTYLNTIFVDDSNKDDTYVAKHISGDKKESVNEDDIDSLIEQFK